MSETEHLSHIVELVGVDVLAELNDAGYAVLPTGHALEISRQLTEARASLVAAREAGREEGRAEERERIARYAIEQSRAEEDRADQYVLVYSRGRAQTEAHMAAGRAFRQIARFTEWKGDA